MANKYFHITIGPVQGFVAQARRTRDFWAGSFLLSWLSGVAMVSVKKQGGDIHFPKPAENYLEWLEGKGRANPPEQGAIPNRFKAFRAEVPKDFEPEVVVESIRQAWRDLAEDIWKQDIEPLTDHLDLQEIRKIWERQINQFWEISWCLSDDESDSNLLDRRKNWRVYKAPSEPGVKCVMMDGWQELSGAKRPGRQGQSERDFWRLLRRKMPVDLRQGEELCAIAFVKRRFAYVFESFSTNMPEGWTLHGWKVPRHVPSVSYLAATHWLVDTLEQATTDEHQSAIWDLYEALESINAQEGHKAKIPKCIKEATANNPHKREWQRLDGQYLFDFIVRAESAEALNGLDHHLQQVYKITETRPSPYYAVLLMDGDSLGSQMSDEKKQIPISEALNEFTQGVPGLVEDHNGFLVYAGGDDVLALLPMEDAMPCALKLRNYYAECFKTAGVFSTLSGAIEYCHIKSPLLKGLQDAHELLDDVAKDATGRDALAVRVWKPGGLHLQWSNPWEKVITGNKLAIEQLAEGIWDDISGDEDNGYGFAWGFFQKVETLFQELGLSSGYRLSQTGITDQEITALLIAIYKQSGKQNSGSPAATALCQQLLAQCRLWLRELPPGDPPVPGFRCKDGLSVDALKLIRFLVTKGQDKEGHRL